MLKFYFAMFTYVTDCLIKFVHIFLCQLLFHARSEFQLILNVKINMFLRRLLHIYYLFIQRVNMM